MRWIEVFLLATLVSVGGCAGVTDLYGGGGGDGTNDNATPDPGFVLLAAITFTEVAAGEDPVSIEIGGGSVSFEGGSADTVGIQALYFDDAFAWMPQAGGTATISFADLDVRAVRVYFAHTGDTAATLVAEDSDGAVIGTIESFAATTLGDANAVFDVDGDGASIARLVIDVPDGVVVAIDQLVLTVPEEEDAP